MCKTPAGATTTVSAFRHRKRALQGSVGNRRPAKRVSFSKCDKVLGWAQDYDRTSFEASVQLRRRRAPSTPPQSTPSPAVGGDAGEQKSHANFCGMWRRSHGFNWASLLLFSGVDEDAIADQAAKMQSSSVVHLIDHDATSFRLVVHSDSGSTQDQHFFIGGQPRPNTSASSSSAASTMLSNMRWAKNGQALVLSSVDAATGDEMTVSRHLASHGSVLVQHYTARRAKTGETAEAITIFRKVVRASGAGSDGDSNGTSLPN